MSGLAQLNISDYLDWSDSGATTGDPTLAELFAIPGVEGSVNSPGGMLLTEPGGPVTASTPLVGGGTVGSPAAAPSGSGGAPAPTTTNITTWLIVAVGLLFAVALFSGGSSRYGR
jgi:hypothetical protein